MKITELRCRSCSGPLTINEAEPDIAVCEYCRSRYVIEWENTGDASLKSDSPQTYYTPKEPEPKSNQKKTGWEPYGWKRGLALGAGGILILTAFYWKGLSERWEENRRLETADAFVSTIDAAVQNTVVPETEIPFTGVLAAMSETVFGKPADTLTEDELSKIQWLELRYHSNGYQVGYSFDSPDSDDAVLTWMELSRDTLEEELYQLSRFTGLKKLYISNYLQPGDLKGLNLVSLGCYAEAPSDLLPLVDNPDEIKELNIGAGLENLTGFQDFAGMERLTLDGSDLTDLKGLVNLKNVKALSLENCDNISDFSVLSIMPWLEELSVDSEAIKDIGFTKGMDKLQVFSLSDAEILTLAGLEGKNSLLSLTITGCDEMKDCSSVSGLTNLEQLSLEVPYGCEQPDLSSLTQVKSLEISGFDTTGFLGNLSALEFLSIQRSMIDRPEVFTGLTQLKELQCSGLSGEMVDWGFTEKLPALERLNLAGVSTYEDISVLFNLPKLSSLVISGMECEIDFTKLMQNTSLRTLEMDGVKLYKNVEVSGNGGIVYVDYDTVTLDEHTDFLSNYPVLENLSLSDNKLTQINFASNLLALKKLDISENYVVDLKPLESLSVLQMVNCIGNPIENYRVLREEITVMK